MEWVQNIDKFILNKHEHNILNLQSFPIVRQAMHFLLVTYTHFEASDRSGFTGLPILMKHEAQSLLAIT